MSDNDKGPTLHAVDGWKTALTGGREVHVWHLSNGEYAVKFNRRKKTTVAFRMTEEAALSLLAMLDKLLHFKLERGIVLNWHGGEWEVADAEPTEAAK